MHMNKRTN